MRTTDKPMAARIAIATTCAGSAREIQGMLRVLSLKWVERRALKNELVSAPPYIVLSCPFYE